jgi:hypothetical protein
MARINNPIFKGLSGRLGDIIRRRFTMAIHYAQLMVRNPQLIAEFRANPGKIKTLYNFAVADFYKVPEFTGRPYLVAGTTVIAGLLYPGRVTSVTADAYTDDDELLETARLTLSENGEEWVGQLASAADPDTARITLVAHDRAGNSARTDLQTN